MTYNHDELRNMIADRTMTPDIWSSLSIATREAVRSTGGLTAQLVGLEGWRVEVTDAPGEAPRRFNVGRSTGWVPCHLEIHNRRSSGGGCASKSYHSVKALRRA